MIDRGEAMQVVASGFRYHVDNAAGRVPKFSLVACCDHLKLGDGVLIELRRCSATQFVLIGKAVYQKSSIVCAFSEDRRGVVAARIRLTIDRDTRNKLQQVKI